MNSIRKLSLVVGVGAIAALGVMAIRHSHKPSITHREQSHQIEPPLLAATPATPATPATSANNARQAVTGGSVNWDAEFRTSTDYFPLIARAAKAALNGDGRAAYYVSRKWLECVSLAHEYGGTGAQPEEKFNEQMAYFASLPPDLMEKKRKEFHDCAGFYKANDRNGNDVFADLPQREGGYTSVKFWMDLAYENNDPIAQIVHASQSASSSLSPTPAQIQVAQVDVNHAIASGDPAAIYFAGMMITNGLYTDRIEGFALSLAACDLGYDCTAKDSNGNDLPFGECVAMGTCSPGTMFTDWVTKNLGAEGYAQAYARAQEIKAALAQGDTSALRKFAQLKGS